MDMPMNVPVDDPNADTEWYEAERTLLRNWQELISTFAGTTSSASTVLSQRSLPLQHHSSKKLWPKPESKPMEIGLRKKTLTS